MKTDIEISQATTLAPITEVAEKINLSLMIWNCMANTKQKLSLML